MRVHCTHCGRAIPADDLNIETAIAKCTVCQAVFSFRAALEQEARRGGPPDAAPGEPAPTGPPGQAAERRYAAAEPIPAPRPEGIEVKHGPDGVVLTRRWNRATGGVGVAFGAIWLVVCFMVFSRGAFAGMGAPACGFPCVFYLAGLLAFGVGLSHLCNSTTITITPHWIRIRHGPLHWSGGDELPAADVAQLFCQIDRSRRRDDHSTSTSYSLHAVMRDGRRRKLIGGIDEPEQALYLEQEIERELRIPDRPVRGEMVR